ncbi:MAG TPA: ABC transporter permease [Bryobacteraceae bacterium]|jgi:predicted permease
MWWRRKNREEDFERELQAHLDLEAEDQQDRGLSTGDARCAARRVFGNPALMKEDVRRVWLAVWLDNLAKDLRYGLRSMRNNPIFSSAAILSLALGIGANTAIFSLIDAVLLRFLPVRDPYQLVQLKLVELGRPGDSFGYPTVISLAGRTDVFEGLAGFAGAPMNVGAQGETERISGEWVTGGFYATMGLESFAGRLLTPSDDRQGAPPVTVLSYSYWKARYGGDTRVLGQIVRIEGKPVRVVGIGPRGFNGADVGLAANLTLPVGVMPQLYPERSSALESGSQWLRVLARPHPGISMEQAKARLAVIWPAMASVATTPRMNAKRRVVLLHSSIDLVPGGTGWSNLRSQFQRPLYVLFAVTGLVLLIACANVANLLLARGAARSREIALRFAVGAGRGRILRQLLTESLLLSICGAAVGIGIAWLASRLLVAGVLESSRVGGVSLDLRPDIRMLLFTTAVAFANGTLFGLLPALRATASGPGAALKGDAGITPRTSSRLLPALVATQVALSLILLIAAGLFVRTLQNLEHLDPGFRSRGVLLVNLDPRRAGYKDARLTALYLDLLMRFQRLPGVVSASLSSNTPLSGGVWSEPVSINAQPPTSESAHLYAVSIGYFATMGTPLLLGRDFTPADRPAAPGAAIVNEAFVRRFLDGPPLGQHVGVPNPHFDRFEIVGVVKDTATQSLRAAPPPALYLPALQYPEMLGAASFELRVEGSLTRTANQIRDELRTRFPAMPSEQRVEPLTAQVRRTLIQERLLAALATCFGALALLLAAVGLYGLLAYTVARSISEIGIRMALGARRAEVLALIMKRALRLLAAGVAVGIPAAWAGSRLISSMLFGLTAADPFTIGMAVLLLSSAAFLAALPPALRASRIDPMTALRHE